MNRMKNIFRQYVSFLKIFEIVQLGFDKSIPAKWRCAIAYFWLMFLFAFVYSLLPGDFYYANASRELTLSTDTVREDTVRIGRELQQEIISTFRNEHGDQFTFDTWRVDASSFQVLFLNATNKETDVEIRFKLATMLTDASKQRRLHIDPIVTFSASEMATRQAAGDLQIRVYRTVTVDVPEVPSMDKEWASRFIKVLFPTPETAQNERSDANSNLLNKAVMPISKELNDRIIILGRGIQGDPTNLSGNFLRMLYLSAATITTLGTNDISPLTTRARLLIIIELVLGIILIGLFLNALVTELKESS